jgi:hypothetical protein
VSFCAYDSGGCSGLRKDFSCAINAAAPVKGLLVRGSGLGYRYRGEARTANQYCHSQSRTANTFSLKPRRRFQASHVLNRDLRRGSTMGNRTLPPDEGQGIARVSCPRGVPRACRKLPMLCRRHSAETGNGKGLPRCT